MASDDRAKRPEPLSPGEAERKIALFLSEGRVVLSLHCRRDSMPERGVDFQDVLSVLESGAVVSDPEWDDKHGNWKYTVEGVDMEDEDLKAVTVLIDRSLLIFVVTVF